MRNFVSLAALAALTVACSEPAETPGEPAPTPDTAPQQPAPQPSAIEVQAMVYDEFSALVPPGLGCVFEGGDAILMVASAPDDRTARPEAAIKVSGVAVKLTGRATGGYIGMYGGDSAFEGQGYVVEIDRAEGDGTKVGVETTSWPARLTVRRPADGAMRELPGDWSCGA